MFAKRTNWPLEPNRLARAMEAQRRSGKPLLDLTASNPTTCGFAYPEREMLDALRDPRALEYRPESKGLRVAREAVAEYYEGRASFADAATRSEQVGRGGSANRGGSNEARGDKATRSGSGEPRGGANRISGNRVDPERIVLTSGTSEAYSHVFRLLCEAGDEILVPAPSYPLLEFLADLADVQLVLYPLLYDHGWQIDFAGLRAALTPRSRAVVVVHPNNPTGSFVKPREAAELAEICAAREMAIVADEVFLDYPEPGGDKLRPYKKTPSAETFGRPDEKARSQGSVGATGEHGSFAFSDAALTFTLSGLSKISALPQMKLAWIVASGPDAAVRAAVERLDVIADTYLSPSTPIQLAAPTFLALRSVMQAQLQERIARNLGTLDATLAGCDAVTRLEREGGWYAVLRVTQSRRAAESARETSLARATVPGHAADGAAETATDEALAATLVERCDVLVHPGSFFNFASDGFLVLSLITPAPEFQRGVQRLVEYLAGM